MFLAHSGTDSTYCLPKTPLRSLNNGCALTSSSELSYTYRRSTSGAISAQLAIDFIYREMILGIGTSCPPFITRLAIRAAFMVGLVCRYEEYSHKVPGLLGAAYEADFVMSRHDSLKNQAFAFGKAILSPLFTIQSCFPDSFRGIPVAELFLCHNVGIDINCVFQPFARKNFGGYGGFARTVGPGNDNQQRCVSVLSHLLSV